MCTKVLLRGTVQGCASRFSGSERSACEPVESEPAVFSASEGTTPEEITELRGALRSDLLCAYAAQSPDRSKDIIGGRVIICLSTKSFI